MKKKQRKHVPAIMRHGGGWAWLYVGPALLLLTVYVAYPTIYTMYLSLRNGDSSDWASVTAKAGAANWGVFENYRYALTSDVMLSAFRNNIIWVILMVGGTVAMGLLFAVLVDRVRYEALAKAMIFMPMAISFVGAGVIWKFVYAFPINPADPNEPIIGLLNAVIVKLGAKPVPWLSSGPWINNLALVAVGIWMWTGFCMTILSAALKSVPNEILEAARMDGATEWRVFWSILVPMILPTITVVMTTMVINTLKLFDIVYVMTGGLYGTDVVANRMYLEMYQHTEFGRASAIAVVLILIIVPSMIINVRRFQEQEAMR